MEKGGTMKLLYSVLILLLAVDLFASPTFEEVAQVIKDGNQKELLRILNEYPDSVSLVNDIGLTPLFIACGWSTIDIVKILINNGADIHAISKTGTKPIDSAISNFNEESHKPHEQRDKIMAYLKKKGAGKAKNEDLILEMSNRPLKKRPNIGPKPEQSEWDSSVDIVKKYILKNAYQPDRIDFLEWSGVSEMFNYWVVRVKFRGPNVIGLEVVSHKWFYIRYNKIVGSKDAW